MPRDSKSSLIQKIASQAHATFKNANGDGKVFAENQARLAALLTEIRASDLRISPPQKPPKGASKAAPPVSYMHICETGAFSMGVFLLRSGVCIPLHDHPGMNGMLKVLYGKVKIRCFDKPHKQPDPGPEVRFEPPLAPFQRAELRLSVLRSTCELTESSAPCLLSPVRDNLHQIDAVNGPAAFLDILAPPYDPDDGRDCHYYKVLQVDQRSQLHREEEDEDEEEEVEEESWLLEIPQPEGFWCGGEPYPGPQVNL